MEQRFSFLLTLTFCVYSYTFATAHQLRDGEFLNSWAVKVSGDEDLAAEVAANNGFINKGKIFDDYYEFAHSGVPFGRMDSASDRTSRLRRDASVAWTSQQMAMGLQGRQYMMDFNDPKWVDGSQWNLGDDFMNLQPAWKDNITGNGVVVAVVDDGLDKDHEELTKNFILDYSFDYNLDQGMDPSPMENARHGTWLAGIIAAEANNSKCIVGVAHGASIAGVRIRAGPAPDMKIAKALSHNYTKVDIYIAPWGPDDDGKTFGGPGEMTREAMDKVAMMGRNGKGGIYVFASGNGGTNNDNCNADGYQQSIYTISVGAASESGEKMDYSEYCSSTLVAGYGGGPGDRYLASTAPSSVCDGKVWGTSASAATVTGIVALALEANPSLTWRDVQHLLVESSRLSNGTTQMKNGAGKMYNHFLGFGVVNAGDLVDLAKRWNGTGEQRKCEVQKTIGLPFTKSKPLYVEFDSGCFGTKDHIKYVEHVQVEVELTTLSRGDTEIRVWSPNATQSWILRQRVNDKTEGVLKWTFLSNHFWGEDPSGTWKVEFMSTAEKSKGGNLKSASLIVYGTSQEPNIEGQCHTQCNATQGCNGTENYQCTECKGSHYFADDKNGTSQKFCVEACPMKGWYENNGICNACHAECSSCDGGGRTNCTQCPDQMYSLVNGECVEKAACDLCSCSDTEVNCDGLRLPRVPAHIPVNTTSLKLGGNAIMMIANGTFDQLVKLTYLDLSGNSISELPTGIFSQLTELDQLLISGTRISSIPSGTFDTLNKLATLEMKDNLIATLPDGIFDQLMNVTMLLLNDNLITALPYGIFDQLRNIEKLFLQKNMISRLPMGVFENMTNLRTLNMTDNAFICSCELYNITKMLNMTVMEFEAGDCDGYIDLKTATQEQLCVPLGQCGGEYTATGEAGLIASPNFPSMDYPSNQTCVYTITAPHGSSVMLTFVQFRLQSHESCSSDSVKIYYDSQRSAGSEIATACGTKAMNEVYKSSGSTMVVVFTSNNETETDGFRAKFVTAQGSCDGVHNATRWPNFIMSPSHPSTYPVYHDCIYKIEAPPGSFVKLTFTSFYLEYVPGCIFDSVKIYDDMWRKKEIANLCGAAGLNQTYLSSGTTMYIVFHSDNAGGFEGFKAEYTSVYADAVALSCYEFKMTAMVNEWSLPGQITNITLWGCNNDDYTVENNTVTTDFNRCKYNVTQDADEITQENMLVVRVQETDKTNTIERVAVYYYNVQCKFNRRLNVSNTNVINVRDRDVMMEVVSKTNFSASMTFYQSPMFNMPAGNPLEVASGSKIYVQIKGVYDNDLFKFVVQNCYATPTPNSANPTKYAFYEERCGLDETFMEHTANGVDEFRFSINAFRFILLKREVYFHCGLLVCKLNSTAEECSQSRPNCPVGYRKRRSVEESGAVEKRIVKSGMIRYTAMPTCLETVCSSNAECHNAFPALCRCKNGFVLHHKSRECINENMLTVRGVHLDIEFKASYHDTSSPEFLKLVTAFETEIMTVVNKSIITGVRVIKASKGSVVLDLLITFATTVSPQEAYDSFSKSIMRSIVEGNLLRLKEDASRMFVLEMHSAKVETSTAFIVLATVVSIVPIMFLLIIIWIKRRRKQKSVSVGEDVAGFDNAGISVDDGSHYNKLRET